MKINIFEILKKTQEELRQDLICKLEKAGYNKMIISNDYLFAKGDIPVLLVAHLDTVHKELPIPYYDKRNGVIWSPTGIGGDDRCGVYAILKIIQKYKPYVLFTTDEEIGGLGASKFVENYKGQLEEINFMIEIDRRGFNQAVFYECGNEKFKEMILSYGLDEEFGTFTDISVLSPAYDIASVNLSAGYYNEHTKHEFIVLDHLEHTINIIERILRSRNVEIYYDYQEITYPYYNYAFEDFDNKDTKQNEKKEEKERIEDAYNELMEEDWHNLSEEDWFETYKIKKPKTEEALLTLLCGK